MNLVLWFFIDSFHYIDQYWEKKRNMMFLTRKLLGLMPHVTELEGFMLFLISDE